MAPGDLGQLLDERGVRLRRARRLAGDRRGRAGCRRAARPAARQAADVGGAARRRRGTVQLVTDTAQRSELWGGETTKAIVELPCLGRADSRARRALAGAHQGSRSPRERRARAARRRQGRADRRRRRPDRGRGARRPVPDRRLPDRLRHLVEHERERGDRGPRRRGRACERRREHGPELERRLSVGGPSRRPRADGQRPSARARAARGGARAEGRGVRRRRQVGPHALDGRGARDARTGVRRVRRPGRRGQGARRGDARAARQDPARRHRRRHRAEHPPRVRRPSSCQVGTSDRARDLAPGRSVRVAGRARRARRGVGCAQDASPSA